MGIHGLLQSLRPIQRAINIRELKGKTVAIDGNCILLRGAVDDATALALRFPTDSYVKYFMQFMGMLKENGVTPIVVFGGLPLPLKQSANDERSRARQAALDQGWELYKKGETDEAKQYFRKSVTISNDMITVAITKLMEKKIKCIIAPSEAAAQLTYLAKTGKVDAIVTEDSDLLTFGCPKVIYNIRYYGFGIEILMDKVINDHASIFQKYDAETIQHMCILSGCDYLPSIKGVRLTTIMDLYDNNNNNTDHVLRILQQQFKEDFPVDYIKKFHLANLGCLHQWVYDMDEKNYVRLNPLPQNFSEEDAKLLGRTPTVQDSIMFIVNEIVPKSKPLKERITEKFLAYAKSAKENIMPSHLGSPFSAALSKSSKSSKTPTSSSGTTPRRVLSELRSRSYNSNAITVSVSVTTTAGEFFAPTSAQASSYLLGSTVTTPREPTQGERLEAPYNRFEALPTASRQATNESTATSMNNVTEELQYTRIPADNSEPPPSTNYNVGSSLNQTSSGQACEINSQHPSLSSLTATSREENKAPYNRYTQASKWVQFLHTTLSSGYIPSNARAEYLKSNTTTYNNYNTTVYNRHTRVKPMASKSAQLVKITPLSDYKSTVVHAKHSVSNTATSIEQTTISPHKDSLAKFMATATQLAQPVDIVALSDDMPREAHNNHSTRNTTTCIKHNTTLPSQHTQARPSASESARAVDTAPSSNHTPYNADNTHATSNKTITGVTTATEPSQNASNGGEKEKNNARCNKYNALRDPRLRHYKKLAIPAHVLSIYNDAVSRKRSFDQTEHSTSATQSNNIEMCLPALLPPPKRKCHYR